MGMLNLPNPLVQRVKGLGIGLQAGAQSRPNYILASRNFLSFLTSSIHALHVALRASTNGTHLCPNGQVLGGPGGLPHRVWAPLMTWTMCLRGRYFIEASDRPFSSP